MKKKQKKVLPKKLDWKKQGTIFVTSIKIPPSRFIRSSLNSQKSLANKENMLIKRSLTTISRVVGKTFRKLRTV